MIKRDTTETIYEYDKEGKLLRKTVTETHEEEEGTTLTYPSCPSVPSCPLVVPNDWWTYVTCDNPNPSISTTSNLKDILSTHTDTTTTAQDN